MPFLYSLFFARLAGLAADFAVAEALFHKAADGEGSAVEEAARRRLQELGA